MPQLASHLRSGQDARMHASLTQMLNAAVLGDVQARDQVLPLLYQRLRELAHAACGRQRHGTTMSTTVLVHELYLDLFQNQALSFADRHKFYAYAAKAMQHLMISNARRHLAEKRGGGARHHAIPTDTAVDWSAGATWAIKDDASAQQLIALDQALLALRDDNSRAAQVLELKFFAGLSESQIAELLQIDVRTVRRDWQKARAVVLLHCGLEVPRSPNLHASNP